MIETQREIALLRAVLLENCSADAAAAQHLAEARRLGVDPLDYCAHRFGLGNAAVWERAAHWTGFGFFHRVAGTTALQQRPVDFLDRLGGTRTVRRNVLGRSVLFAAPSFEALLGLEATGRRERHLVRHLCIVPPEAIEAALVAENSTRLMDEARQRLARQWSGLTASTALPRRIRRGFALLLLALIVLVIAASAINRPLLLPLVAMLLALPGLLRLAACLPRAGAEDVRLLTDAELPVYSVLIPLRDEANMVPMLARAMSALDYPPERLDVRFIVEDRSPETVDAVRKLLRDPRFRLTVVPECAPHTKPKALNYALPLARGAHVVVYDAEDAPEPDQLRRAASHFAADPTLACLQAELVPDNADENALTALFAGEYAGLFGRFLPSLSRWGLPVPLGGTSNHFRIEALRAIGGWDAYNVTEDADLGVRLRRVKMRAVPFNSRTYEEAPTSLAAWMAQRTRWMKGWVQTYLVHGLDSRRLLGDMGWRAFVGFHVLVGGMIFTALLHTVFAGLVVARFVAEGPAGFVPTDLFDWISLAVLALGYGGAAALALSGLAHLRAWHLAHVQLLLPFYWLLHSIAALRAVYEFNAKPFYWAKTTHGVTRKARGETLLPRDPGRATVTSRSG